MYTDEAFTADDAELLLGLDLAGRTLTSLDPEFHHLIADPTLSAELAELRRPQPEATTALLDGSARERRERREAQRKLGNAVRVLRVHTAPPVTTDGEAA